MTREELLAIGVPENVIKPLQDLEGRDKERVRRNVMEKMKSEAQDERGNIISALVKLAHLLTLDNLNGLLFMASDLYEEQISEARNKKRITEKEKENAE